MALTPARVALLLLAACLTAVATLTIGPLSFQMILMNGAYKRQT
jgi:ABC-type Fe3+-siderophore transport system permease subunit